MSVPPSAIASKLRRWVGPVVSLVSLTAVVWWALGQHTPAWPRGASRIGLLGVAVLAYAAVTALRGVRWHAILQGAGVPAPMADAQALVVVGYMGNTVLPARGGELLRMYFMGERTGSSRISILGTILAERTLDVLALSGMLVGLALATAASTHSLLTLWLAVAGALLVLAVALAMLRRASRAGRLGSRLASFTLASRNLFSAQGAMLVALTVPVWAGEGCIYWLVGRALDMRLGLLACGFLVAISSLAAAIPAAPGYVGTYDASIQFGLRALHWHGGQAVGFGLLVRLVIFVPITVLGLGLVVFRYGGRASLSPLRRIGARTAVDVARAERLAVEPEVVK